MNKQSILATAAALGVAVCANAGTGWTNTVGGAQRFHDPANWDDGDVNGVFPAEWTPAEATTIQLTNDWTGSLSFLGSIDKDTTFAGRNAQNLRDESRTITLDRDLLIRPTASAGKLIFNATVGLDLGGVERSFETYSPSSADKFRVNGPITNGDLVLAGNGAGMTLVGAAAVSGDVSIGPNTTLALNWATAGSTVRRADDIELRRATLSAAAYRGNDTAEFGALTISGRDAPGASILSINPGNYVATVHADSLSITNGGTLAVMTTTLGAAEAPSSQLVLDEAPTLVGGILPSVFASTATTASSYGSGYGALRFTTYDSERGLRALGTDEMATTISESGEVNLYVKSATISIESDATVNAVCLDAEAWADTATISGDAKLRVRSGQILASSSNGGMTIAVPVDFGNARGSVTAMGWHHRAVNITKPFSGTAGLVLTKAMPMSFDLTQGPSSGAAGFVISGADIVDEGAYTGDTWIQCIVNVNSTPFLPHGARTGNTIVNGCLSFGTIALNGLYGSGAVRGTSLTVGEDGSDSAFSGTAVLTSSLNITNSTMILDGSVTQGAVNVAADAAIGGGGSIASTLTFAEGAKLSVAIAGNAAPCLDVAGAVTGSASVEITAPGRVRDNFASCILRSGSAMPTTFTCATKGYRLELRAGNTELWVVKKPEMTFILIQ